MERLGPDYEPPIELNFARWNCASQFMSHIAKVFSWAASGRHCQASRPSTVCGAIFKPVCAAADIARSAGAALEPEIPGVTQTFALVAEIRTVPFEMTCESRGAL